MPCRAIGRFLLAQLLALSLCLAANSALAALSGSATLSTTSTSAPYSYTINLKNTGTTPIEGFWFAWTPPNEPAEYNFLQSVPSVQFTGDAPDQWYGYYSQGIKPSTPVTQGYGVEYYDYYNYYYGTTQYGIAPGATGQFHFTSNDSPAQLTGSVGGYPITTSVIYAGYPEASTDSFLVVSVPEPAGFVLAGIGAVAGLFWRGRRRKTAN